MSKLLQNIIPAISDSKDFGIKDLCISSGGTKYENQVIVFENLQIKNMVKNHHLAKSINDVSWYELTRQLVGTKE